MVTVGPDAVSIIKDSHKVVSGRYQEFLASLPRDKVAMFQGADLGWSQGVLQSFDLLTYTDPLILVVRTLE